MDEKIYLDFKLPGSRKYEDSNRGRNWGGYREGSGTKFKWNHGRTITVRIPVLLVDDVVRYARLIDGQYPSCLQVSECLSCQIGAVSESRALSDRLKELTQQYEQLDKEVSHLHERNGDLLLEIDELKERLTMYQNLVG